MSTHYPVSITARHPYALYQSSTGLDMSHGCHQQHIELDQAFFFHGPMLFFVWRCAEGWPVEYVSPNIARLLGYQADDVTSGRVPYSSIVHPDDLQRVAAEARTGSAEGQETFEQEYRLLHANGETRWISVFMMIVREPKGTITHYYGYMLDITKHKQSEEKARQSSEILQMFIDTLPQPVFWQDRTRVYQAFATMAGVGTPEQVIGKTDDDLAWQPEEAEFFRMMGERVMQTDTAEQTIVERQVQADSKLAWLNTNKIPLHDEHGQVNGIMAIFDDITERKQIETELETSQQFLRLIIDHIPQAIFWKARDLTYLGCNQYFADAAGLVSPGDIVGKNDFDMPWVDIADLYRADDSHVMEHDKPKIGFEEPFVDVEVGVTNETKWLRTTKIPLHTTEGDVFAVLGLFEDITERKQQEIELQMHQFALDHASDGVELMTPDGQLVYVNTTACKQLGYHRDELIGKTLADIDPNFPPHQWSIMWNYIKQSGSILLETVHQRKDGTIFPVEISGTYLQIGDKEFALGTVRNITERKRQEAERTRLQEQVIAAQRATLRELSTPLIPISDTVVIMPLIGTIDSQRAQMILDTLLEGVARRQARLVILDITGVATVDTQVAQALITTAQAVKLLGAQVMLTGIQPQIAQALVQLGVDLRGIITRATLQVGIASALQNTTKQH
ncbi:MAG: PAS domain S-box protein [Chloroflexaceae bacterium]|nr:PAS domain S-box protein [Chloroflexaceae bacterium]